MEQYNCHILTAPEPPVFSEGHPKVVAEIGKWYCQN
jgi:hypothetical protein